MRSSSHEELLEGRDRGLGVDGGSRGERAARAAEVEPGARAVGVALLLAEVHVQPRVEQPAEDRAHDGDRVEVGVLSRQARVADPDLRLDGARPMDDEHATRVDARRVVDRPRRRHGSPAQSPNSRSTIASTSSGSTSPATTSAERPGTNARSWTARSSAAVSVATVSAVPPAGRWYGRRRRVDRGHVRLVGAAAGVGLRLEQVGQPLVAQPLDLGRRERRAGARPRRAARAPAASRLAGHVEPGGRRVPAGLGVDRRAEPLGGLVERDRVADLGALGEAAGGEDGCAARAPRGSSAAPERIASEAETSSRPGIGVTMTRRPFGEDEARR